MKVKIKGLLCLVLAVLLLAGCAKGADGSEANSEQQTQAQEWRQAYYDVVVQAIDSGRYGGISRISMYYMQDAPPRMLITFFDDTEHWNAMELWGMTKDEAVIIYEGSDHWYIEVSAKTGNPVVWQGNAGWYGRRIELDDGKDVPLYEYQDIDGEMRLYTFSDNKLWTAEEEYTEYPVQNMQINGPYEEIFFNSYDNTYTYQFSLGDTAKKQLLADYFLDAYQPAIPKEAPAWVYTYMRYVRTNMLFSYLPTFTQEDKISLRKTLGIAYLELYEPLNEGGAPVFRLKHYDEPSPWIMATVNGTYLLEGYYDGGHDFYKDSEGNGLIAFNEIGSSYWYRPTAHGKDFLFDEEDSMNEPGILRIGAKEFRYENFNTGVVGADAAREDLLRKHGYVPPLKEVEPSNYALPEECNWPELEAALIEALCDYARRIDQWGE